MGFKIVVANQIHESVKHLLAGAGALVMNDFKVPWDATALSAHCVDANALMAFMTESIDAEFLDRCPELQIIAGALKGYNNIDVAACTERGVLVTNVPDLLTEPTAELTLGLMIGVARNLIPADRLARSDGFRGWRPNFYGGSLDGSTVGVVGAGAVGQAVLRRLIGFRCRCLYVDKRPLPPSAELELQAERSSLEAIQTQADFIVLALHLMPETYHLVNGAFLSRMKPSAYLVNPARGSLVDEAAVASALSDGRLAGYAADTFEMEDWALEGRPREIHPALRSSDRAILTPHIGSAVATVREAIERSAAESILAVRNGTVPDAAINPEARR